MSANEPPSTAEVRTQHPLGNNSACAAYQPSYAHIVLLALAPAIGLGLARFAYALLLPSMKESLLWNFSAAGWMNTANAIGYLVGALMFAPLIKQLGVWRVLQFGVVGCAFVLFVTGLSAHFNVLTALRFLAGIFGAFCLTGGGLMAAILAGEFGERSNTALSLFYIGPGVGITLSGVILPSYIAYFGPPAWASAWLVLGSLAGILALLFHANPAPKHFDYAANSDTENENVAWQKILPIMLGYGALGAGYIGYMTFMFAYLQLSGAGTIQLTLFWMTIGVSAIAAPWTWRRLPLSEKKAIAFSVLTASTLVGALIPLISTSTPALFLSAAIFGGAFFSATAETTAFAKRNTSPNQWPAVIGMFTVAFGLGQVIGPVFTGFISDRSGSLSTGLAWGCALLVLAVVMAWWQRG